MQLIDPPIAQGATSEIFAWGDREVLKLFRRDVSQGIAHREAANARYAYSRGVATPKVVDLVTADDRAGIVFQRCDGPTMLQVLRAEPARAGALAQQLALLHAEIHARAGGRLPEQNNRLARNIANAKCVSEHQRQSIALLLRHLPEGGALCHGDFHPGNVVMTSSGPMVIDWADACCGNPVGDVALTCFVLEQAVLSHPVDARASSTIAQVRAAFCAVYLRHYRARMPAPAEELAAWRLPLAAAGLSDELPSVHRQTRLAIVRRAFPPCER
jgi:uncharacterized protein (TIGR02172 family)